MRGKILPFILPSALLIACGGDDGGVTPAVDAQPVDAPIVCSAPANYGDKGAMPGRRYFVPGMDAGPLDDNIWAFGVLEDSPRDVVIVDLWAGEGTYAGGAVRTGTVELTAAELSPATCGACVWIATDVTEAGITDYYWATSGSINVTQVGFAVNEQFAGTLSNVKFQHVTIDQMTGVATPHPDGCKTEVTGGSWSGAMVAEPMQKTGDGRMRARLKLHLAD